VGGAGDMEHVVRACERDTFVARVGMGVLFRRAALAWIAVSAAACASLSGLSTSSHDAAVDAAAVHDAAVDAGPKAPVAFLFGGSTAEGDGNVTPLSDTWSFNGDAWAHVAAPEGPMGRNGMSATVLGSQVVLFGGIADENFLNDTWGFSDDFWTELDDGSGNAPSPRAGPGFAALGSHIVLFGGVNDGFGMNDTWLWDGMHWSQVNPTTSPASRDGMVMMPFKGGVVLFGGDNNGNTGFDDTWTWDGTNWTELHPAHHPPARAYAMSALQTGEGEGGGDDSVLLVFGGLVIESISALGDMWTWNGTDWTELHPPRAPVARLGGMMASIPTGAVLFGGRNSDSSESYGDTWLWDGTTWAESHAIGPDARSAGVMMSAP